MRFFVRNPPLKYRKWGLSKFWHFKVLGSISLQVLLALNLPITLFLYRPKPHSFIYRTLESLAKFAFRVSASLKLFSAMHSLSVRSVSSTSSPTRSLQLNCDQCSISMFRLIFSGQFCQLHHQQDLSNQTPINILFGYISYSLDQTD